MRARRLVWTGALAAGLIAWAPGTIQAAPPDEVWQGALGALDGDEDTHH